MPGHYNSICTAVVPEKLDEDVRPTSQNPYPSYIQSAIFPRLFITSPNIGNPLYDQYPVSDLRYTFPISNNCSISANIDPLHKWRLYLNNNTLYILSLVLMFRDKGFFSRM